MGRAQGGTLYKSTGALNPLIEPSAGVSPESSRRRLAARGVVINSVFLTLVGGLNLLKAFIVARFLTAAEFGVWSVLLLLVMFVVTLKGAAVGERYIQQDEDDQREAFQKAFTLELISAVALAALLGVAMPVIALVYGESQLLAPGLAMTLMLFGLALQAPIWVFYRRMDFLRQRLLLAIDPVVSFVVTILLVAAGADYWSLVIGAIAGAWVGGVVAVAISPYPLALRFDRETTRGYVSFSWPLIVAVAAGLGIAQLSVLFGDFALGLAGAGAIGLAGFYSTYVDKVDQVVTQALYPAVCRVVDRPQLLLEVFIKSNRLALIWGVPFGVALTLFAADLIEYGIGDQWAPALTLFQVIGLIGAINHIGFNWGAFYRARGETRPVAIVTVSALGVFLVTAVPLLFSHGLDGFAVGIAAMGTVSLCLRAYFVRRLFPGFRLARHTVRALTPTIPAVAAVLLLRAVSDPGGLGHALLELGLYVAVTAAATLVFERRLLREAVSYLRKAGVAPLASNPV